ncbi:MAG: hypothetical protein FWD19_02595, partial [Defluviitaleaceae bacterium]|nr:hypothetical protein [Defluviitaleaceae bacterium]
MKNFFRFGFVIFFAVAAVFATEIPPEQNFYIKTDRAEINFSHARDGFISARFLEDTDKIVKILIENENKNRYQYYLNTEKSWEILPLSEGDGIYSVGIFEQVHGNFFSHAASAKIEVVLRDEFAPFLRAN